MPSSSPPPPNTYVHLVVYCDEKPDPYTLPDIHLPHHLEGLKRFVEDNVGQRAKLLSYWNYAHSRYELLRDVRELLQEEGLMRSKSPRRSRLQSRVRGGDRDEGLDTSPSRSGGSSSGLAARQSSRVYRCQLWMETFLLQLEPLDARRDKAEYDELRNHVAQWLGNKHIGYEVQDALRIRCPFLTRMFDETRSTRLNSNQNKVQLLYYSNNAWSVRDILQYGFVLNRGVPKSMTAAVQAQSSGSDISTTTGTHLSIPVQTSMQTGSSVNAACSSGAPSSPLDDAMDSLAHPFIFTSSMLAPNVKHLPARRAPHKVLLCEVAPGRRFMTDQSLTSERTDKQSLPRTIPKAPPGYDSVCYMRTREDKPSAKLEDEASTNVEDITVVQVQVGHSYQALPRYLLTVAPSGGPPLPHSFFDSSVSATASPVLQPCLKVAATATRQDAERQHSPRSSRPKGRWPSPNTSAPQRHTGTLSTPRRSLTSTPYDNWESGGDHRSGNGNRDAYSTPRRATSAAATLYPGFNSSNRSYYASGCSGAVSPVRALLQSRSCPDASPPICHRESNVSGNSDAGRYISPPQNSQGGSPAAETHKLGCVPSAVNGSNNESPSLDASHSRVSGVLGLEPPTPPSVFCPDASQNTSNGLLYRGLQTGMANNRNRDNIIDTTNAPHQWMPPDTQNRQSDGPERSSDSHLPPTEGMSVHPLIPAYRDSIDRPSNNNDGGGGERGPPRAAPVPPSSITRKSFPSFGRSPPLPPQTPPAAFNQFLCAVHPRQLQSLYCTACEELTCPYCASIGAHRHHVVVEASDRVTAVYTVVQKLYEELRHWLNEYRRKEEELRVEHSSYLARQQRQLRALRQNFQTLKQTLLQTERNMTQTVQQGTCLPPLAEASAVISKYTQALRPISAALNRYHVAQHDADEFSSQAPPGQQSAVNGGRGATRSVPEMLYFLRTAPPLVRRVQQNFAQHHQDEERRLRDGIARYRARASNMEGAYADVDWIGLKKLFEHLGRSRSTRVVSDDAARERSSSPSFLDGAAGSGAGSTSRVRGCISGLSSPMSRVFSLDGATASRQLVSGRSPIRRLAIGDDLASYVSHRAPPPPTKRDRLLLRCLEDLQRGHIWTIQNASFYFSPGQVKAVCSTPFRLLSAQWELRIAPLPPSHRKALQNNGAPSSSSLLVSPGVNVGMMATTACTWVPANVRGSGDSFVTRSPLATHSLMNAGERAASDSNTSEHHGQPEEEWLGLFLFPLEHRLRIDFRVIAFSEVTWAEWPVTGWTTEMAGKGWGLYPFLQRKELMRTDKLARENTVKICVAAISDVY